MTDSPASNELPTDPNGSHGWAALLVAALLAAAGQGVMLQTLGVSLEWFFLAAVLIVAVTPGMAAASHVAPLVSCLSLACVLTYAPMTRQVSWMQWAQINVLLLSLAVALSGLTRLILRIMRKPLLATGSPCLLGLAWLTAPVWLGVHAPLIVHVHPLMALNQVLIDFGLWTERPIAYRYLFALGQDVPYTLPLSIWPCVGLHGGLGALLSVLCLVFRQHARNTKHEIQNTLTAASPAAPATSPSRSTAR